MKLTILGASGAVGAAYLLHTGAARSLRAALDLPLMYVPQRRCQTLRLKVHGLIPEGM